MEITVTKKFIHTTPDKIRLIINLIKGWKANEAISQLRYLNKAAALPVIEIIKSGISAAKNKDLDLESLKIEMVKCDEGPRLKRRRVIHKGRATAINKRMSHITLILKDEERNNKKNPKSETRNPKQIQKTENSKFKTDIDIKNHNSKNV